MQLAPTLKNRDSLIYAVTILAGITFPFLGFLLSIFYYLKKKNVITGFFFLSFFCGLVGSTQVPSGTTEQMDIVSYLSTFGFFDRISLLDFIEFNNKHYKVAYLGFNFISYLSLQVPSWGPRNTVFLWIFLYYFLTLYSSYLLCKKLNIEFKQLTLIVIGLGIVNFPQATELLKQQPAIALYTTGLVILMDKTVKKRAIGLSIIILSALIHPMTIVYNGLLIISYNIALLSMCAILCTVLAFLDLNSILLYIFQCKDIPVSKANFICNKVISYLDFGWNATLLKHYSLQIIWAPLFALTDDTIKHIKESYFFRALIALFFFLVFNISNDHNYIRFLYASPPFMALTYIYTLTSKRHLVQITGKLIGFTFVGYNLLSIYMRLTRETYQSTYIDNSILKLIGGNILYYFNYPR